MPGKETATEIGQLKQLADRPEEQAAFAVTLLTPRHRRDVLQAALDVLAQAEYAPARDAILALYRHYAERGEMRDPGCYMRRSVLRAWRPLARPDDVPLLLAAVNTYEFLPPDFKEEAILLRAGALVILNDLDETLARFHAARLLDDGYADAMSGEPALTAARVLASQDQAVALYAYAMRHGGTLADVVSECLRSLTDMPTALVPSLLTRHADNTESIVLVGLFDLLLNHREGPLGRAFLDDYLREGADPDAYRYLAMTVIARGDELLVDTLLTAARLEQDPDKVAIMAEALALLSTPEADEIRAQLNSRLQPRTRRRR